MYKASGTNDFSVMRNMNTLLRLHSKTNALVIREERRVSSRAGVLIMLEYCKRNCARVQLFTLIPTKLNWLDAHTACTVATKTDEIT